MAELSPKIKEALALLYDYPEFKALEAWNEVKANKFLEQILKIDMSSHGADKRVAMLQGQVLSHRLMLEEIRKIHKEQSADASAN